MSNKIEQAKLLATFIHHDQKRRDGEDYIHHCERIVTALEKKLFEENELHYRYNNPFDEVEVNLICAAWLHDCIEDYPVKDRMMPNPISQLIEEIFGMDTWNLVMVLTHHSTDSYNEYITKVFQHSTAWQIKWLDMIDNTNYEIPEEQKTKYRDACIHLMTHGVTVPDILKERLEI